METGQRPSPYQITDESLAEFRRPQAAESILDLFFREHVSRKNTFHGASCAPRRAKAECSFFKSKPSEAGLI